MDRLSSIPLYLQLKKDIVSKIEEEEWQVGDQIPSEKELMRMKDVGRETVRKAISILVQEGYLIKKRGIGTFIAKRKPSIGFEPLISLSHSLQVRGLKEKNKVLQNKVIEMDSKLTKITKMNENRSCHYIERLRYVDGKPLALEYAYLINEDTEIKYNFEKSIATYLLEVLKITITSIEQVITPRVPTQEEIRLLQIEASDTILEMDRWIYIEGEESVYFYVKFVIPADVYSYSF